MRKLQKTEVRIGNYFILVDSFDCRENDEICRISESDFEDNNWDRKIPIIITEELLLKFGYKKIKFLNEYFVQEAGYKFHDMIIRYGCFESHRFLFDFANEKVVNLKYVHQLQNLYFDLCGEELVFSTEP